MRKRKRYQKYREKLQMFAKEEFKEIKFEDKLKLRYAISNFGRFVSFQDSIEYGRVLKCSITEGFRLFQYAIRNAQKKNYKHKFLYRLVAENFLPKTSPEQVHVLHLDHDLSNDDVSNLKWATKKEMLAHQNTNPKVIEGRKVSLKRLQEVNKMRRNIGRKLIATQVKHIKMLLATPKRKTQLKDIAKQFGISDMQLYRISTGENWRHVRIDKQKAALMTEEQIEEKFKIFKHIPEKKRKLPSKPMSWDEKLKAYQKGEKSEIISKWVSRNRREHKNGELSEIKLDKLKRINFSFEAEPKTTRISSWDRQLEEWKKGNRKSSQIQMWKMRSIKRYVKGKLEANKIAKLKEVGILR